MRWRAYYWTWVTVAFQQPFGIAAGLAASIAIIGAATTQYFPGVRDTVGILAWLLPATIFIILAVTRLLLAPYWMHKEQVKRKSNLEIESASLQARISQALESTATVPVYDILQRLKGELQANIDLSGLAARIS